MEEESLRACILDSDDLLGAWNGAAWHGGRHLESTSAAALARIILLPQSPLPLQLNVLGVRPAISRFGSI